MPYIAEAAAAETEGAALLEHEDEVQTSQKHGRRTSRGLAVAAVAAVAGTAAVTVCMTSMAQGRHFSASSTDFNAEDLIAKLGPYGPTPQCPQMEVNVDYQDTSGIGRNFDHIPSPDLCCSLCQAYDWCEAFTWIKNAGLKGNPSQCWVKGSVGIKVPNSFGKASGVPPPRVPLQFGAIPSGLGMPFDPLYCFSLMMPTGYEGDLIRWQHRNKASIFGCDAYDAYSNQQLELAPGLVTKVVQSDLKCDYGGDSQSALNTWIFVAVWKAVIDDGTYLNYKWVVKTDPDTVFFPHRLIQILPAYENSQYINNCKYGMHGPIEVFNNQAIQVLAAEYAASIDGKQPERCITQLPFDQWGEDMFMDQCLSKILNLNNKPLVPRIVCEDHCGCPDFYWCQKGSDRVAYHPFKSVGAYENCVVNALQDQQPAIVTADLMVMAPTR